MLDALLNQTAWQDFNRYLFALDHLSDYSTHLKDAETGQCIQSNPYQAKNLGLVSTDEAMGLTIADRFEMRCEAQKRLGYLDQVQAKFKNDVHELQNHDNQVLINRTLAIDHSSLVSLETGFVQIIKFLKAPIFGIHKKVKAILSVDQNITARCELISLLALYIKYYPEEWAIQRFSTYLGINPYFSKLPTCQELKVLLWRYRSQSKDRIAQHLGLSIQEVKACQNRIQSKLSINSLSPIFETLSMHTRTETVPIGQPMIFPD